MWILQTYSFFCILFEERRINLQRFAEVGMAAYVSVDRERHGQMARDKDIEAGAKAIAADLALPGWGRKKLARVVGDHLDWFDAVEARGLTWNDMTRLLFAAGAKGRGNRPISVGTLSSAVWRKRKNTLASLQSARTQTNALIAPPQNGPRKGIGSRSVLVGGEPPAPAISGKISKTSIERRTATESTPQIIRTSKIAALKPPENKRASKAETLAFMKRAAAMRRKD